jgi:hypothetical protein
LHEGEDRFHCCGVVERTKSSDSAAEGALFQWQAQAAFFSQSPDKIIGAIGDYISSSFSDNPGNFTGQALVGVASFAIPGGAGVKALREVKTLEKTLRSLAEEVRTSGLHPLAVDKRTIAVGIDAEGNLFAGSSNGFDRGQSAALSRLGISKVTGSSKLHAEEELLRGVPNLKRVGTSVRMPCGASEHNCALQMSDRGVEMEN